MLKIYKTGREAFFDKQTDHITSKGCIILQVLRYHQKYFDDPWFTIKYQKSKTYTVK